MVGDNGNKIIDVQKMNLEEWLDLVFSSKSEKYIFIDYMFPNISIRDEYLETIQERDEREVIDLLRKFLIPSGTFYSDKFSWEFLLFCKKNDKEKYKKLISTERYRRLLQHAFNNKIPAWEGNTWIIDLLPHNPKLAIDAIDAYFEAHIQFLPDGRFSGLQDAKAIIRSKFIHYKHPDETLSIMDPYDFEYLISALYREMKYETKVTKKVGDGGVDIIAKKESIGENEILLVQCKRLKDKVGEPQVVNLLGAVTNVKANRGVLVTTSDFSKHAKRFASENHIELINGNDINNRLNEYMGTNWPLHLDYILQKEKDENANLKNSPDKILFSIDNDDFKYLVSALYRKRGYKTIIMNLENIIIKNSVGKSIVISCNKSQKNVGINQIKNLEKIMENEDAEKGIFVNTSDFTPKAKEHALQCNIKLINTIELYKLLKECFGTRWLSDSGIIINEEKEKIKNTKNPLKT
ncbi:MAG: restriction endonuclease [Methanobrevibacter sp.]|nr:restriction endonuclease [Candidatus Methanoflexus mossambicus]